MPQKVFAFFRTTPGIIIAAAFLALTPLQSLSFIIVLVLASRLIPFGSWGLLTRLLLSFSLSMCAVTCIAVAAWAIHAPINAPVVVLLLLAIVAGLARFRSPAPWPRIDRYDLTSAGLALGCMIFVALPILQATNAASVLRIISAGGDNSAHIDMIKASDLNQGIAYGTHNRVNAPGGAINYPQGWHFNLAFYKWLGEPLMHYKSKPGKFLVLFYTVSTMWFGMLIFFIMRLGLRLAEHVRGRLHPLALLGAAMLTGGIALHWLLQLFTHGFQAQTASLGLLVMEALLLAEAFSRPAAKRYSLLLLAAILAVGCNFVWVFIMPITCGVVGLAVILTIVAAKKLPSWPICAAFAALAGMALVQPLFYLIYPVTFEFPIILQRGDINPTSMLAILTIFSLLCAYLVIRGKSRPLRICFATALTSLLFALGLMLYQLHELHELRYFYYKSTYTFIVLAAALLVMVVADGLSYISRARLKPLALGSLGICMVIASGLLWWQTKDLHAESYTNGSLGGMSGPEALALINQVAKGSETAADTVFIGSCNRGDDIRASLFVAALTFDPISRKGSFDPGALDETKVFATIKRATDDPVRHVTVVSGDQVVMEHLTRYLGADAHKITVVSLDTTPETEPVTQCPDRIRSLQSEALKT